MPMAHASPMPVQHRSARGGENGGSMSPVRVALADDHAVVRSGCRRLLELDENIRVVAEFASGAEACEWLDRREADVLVLDLSMSGMSGLETLKYVHAHVPALRVLIFTMHDAPHLVSQALDSGAAGYVTKSSPPGLLTEAVLSVAEGGRPISVDVLGDFERMDSQRLPHARLTKSELAVFLSFARGLSVEEVSSAHDLVFKTAANYQALLRRKLGLRNSLEMYRYAAQHGLIAPDEANGPLGRARGDLKST